MDQQCAALALYHEEAFSRGREVREGRRRERKGGRERKREGNRGGDKIEMHEGKERDRTEQEWEQQ